MFSERKILNSIEKKALVRRYFVFVLGLLITAVAYNLFFVRTGLMIGGAGGIAILFKNKIDPSLTILVISIIGLIVFFSLLILIVYRGHINNVLSYISVFGTQHYGIEPLYTYDSAYFHIELN